MWSITGGCIPPLPAPRSGYTLSTGRNEGRKGDGFQLHPVKRNPDSEARRDPVLPGLEGRQSGATWNKMECRGTGLGRRRPKLKKCRVPNTQISFQLATFAALRAKKVKNTRAPKARAPAGWLLNK
jgi:hypothetical protein